MSRKGELAKFIMDEGFKVTYNEMVKYQETHSYVKVKKSGQQVLVQVDGDKAFQDAESFARNYIANLRQRVNDSIHALEEVEETACGATEVQSYWDSACNACYDRTVKAFDIFCQRNANDPADIDGYKAEFEALLKGELQ